MSSRNLCDPSIPKESPETSAGDSSAVADNILYQRGTAAAGPDRKDESAMRLTNSARGRFNRTSSSVMTFRDHPLMQYRGMRNWPPIWIRWSKQGSKTVKGEVGILKEAHVDPRNPQQCFLVIEHQHERYMGALLFDDQIFCWLISQVLLGHRGWSVEEIGGLDLAFTL
jgi:hypothetical protein